MKRAKPNKDSAYTRVTKMSRLSSSANSAGTIRVDSLPTQRSSLNSDSEEENVHPNVLLERLMTQKLESMVQKYCMESRPPPSSSRNVSGEKIIPVFDPDSSEYNVKNWLAKIDQLGLVHKWDDYSKIVIMQTRLAGQAQLWFSRLDEYDYTWDQWKSMLIDAFPRNFEFADMLEELVSRKKLTTESVTHYYHEKLAMCRRCRFDDAATLSCIIKGLPADLQNNAKAFKCETPEEFYSGYLSSFESYRNKPDFRKTDETSTSYNRIAKPDSEKRKFFSQSVASTSRQNLSVPQRRINCFRCNSSDHMVKDCPMPDRRICKFCSEVGHNINRCPKIENLMKKGRENHVSINIVQNVNDLYKKDVMIENKNWSAYLDTGAQLNVITLEAANKLKGPINDTNTILKGFTGDTVPAMGQIKFSVEIDGLTFETTAVVTHMKLPADVNLIIGQPIINSQGITLITTQNSATLKSNVSEIDSDDKYRVTLRSSINIPPKESSIVEVNIVGNNTNCNVCTTPRIFDMGGEYFAVPATLLRGSNGYLRIYNMGEKEMSWKEGEMIARAVPCEPDTNTEQTEGNIAVRDV